MNAEADVLYDHRGGEVFPFRRRGILTPCSVHDVQSMLAGHFDARRNLVVPNVSWGFFAGYEADLVIVTPSGYLTEIEIKRSWGDFLADFRKRFYHDDPRIARFFYAVPECMYGPCREYVETLVGEGSPLVRDRVPGFVVYRTPSEPKYRRVTEMGGFSRRTPAGVQKLTGEEMYQLARLGTLRYWSLLDKLASAEKRIADLRGGKELTELRNLLVEIKADYKAVTGESWRLEGGD